MKKLAKELIVANDKGISIETTPYEAALEACIGTELTIEDAKFIMLCLNHMPDESI